MTSRSGFNPIVFLMEGLNALATGLYFNYLFFLLKSQYGFTNYQNLLVCALNGLIFAPSAIWGGRFGQKRGYLRALTAGHAVMIVALAVAAFFPGPAVLILTMVVWTVGMCFTWPNLEALIAEKQEPKRLPGILGIYNIVWSGGGALAYFSGGAIVEFAGWRSIFWIPIGLHLLLAAMAAWYHPVWERLRTEVSPRGHESLDDHHPRGPAFLKMAWIANPFAYVAINTVVPLIPDLAGRLQLTPKSAGFFCSIWFFARVATFAILALWPGWHYRFSHLALAYLGTMGCFASMLLLTNLWALIVVQLLFGWCIGLIYYSSLYYSMHVGETKGEHGGFHEAAIGAGICVGPAIGAGALHLFPAHPQSSIIGVSITLAIGLAALLYVWAGSRPKRASAR